MTWLQRYRVRQFVRNSLWFGPVLGMVAALAAVRPLVSIDRVLNLESPINPDAARAVPGDAGGVHVHLYRFRILVLIDRGPARQRGSFPLG